MNKITITTIITVMILYGCNTENSQSNPSNALSEDIAQKELLKNTVKATLKDPGSALFGEITLGEKFSAYNTETKKLVEGRFACLSVNAKNSFGGYTGEQHWLLTQSSGGPWQIGFDYASHSKCVTTQLKK
jgi:hypothetical protein